MTPPTISPQNIHTATLRERIDGLRRAWRHPLAPGCSPQQFADEQAARIQAPPPPSGQALRSTLLHVPIDTTAATTAILPAGIQGRKLIYEVFIWNVAAQTIEFWQGTSFRFLKLTSFPATTGLLLGFNGSFDQPHFDVDPTEPFIIIAGGTQIDGYVKYRIPATNF